MASESDNPEALDPVAGFLASAYALPAWVDAEFLVRSSKMSVTLKTFTLNTQFTLAPNNPRRWMIGVIATTPFGARLNISPDPAPATYPLFQVMNLVPIWWTLFDRGLVVPYEIYGQADGNGSCKVFECIAT